MKAKLYPCFEKWLAYDNIFIISDPHFADEDVKQLRKNYIGDDELVKRINSKVGKNSLLICLGDVGDIEFVKKLKAGYKVLIMGNHDKGKTNYQRGEVQTEVLRCYGLYYSDGAIKQINKAYSLDEVKEMCKNEDVNIKPIYEYEDNHLFDEVYEGPLMINDRILLTHEPVDWKFGINIHGHDHSNSEGYNDDLHINVCAEHINYTPISLTEIIKSGRLSKAIDIHRQTIDKAIKRKAKKITKSEN